MLRNLGSLIPIDRIQSSTSVLYKRKLHVIGKNWAGYHQPSITEVIREKLYFKNTFRTGERKFEEFQWWKVGLEIFKKEFRLLTSSRMLTRLSKHGMISIFERSPNQNMQFIGISPRMGYISRFTEARKILPKLPQSKELLQKTSINDFSVQS